MKVLIFVVLLCLLPAITSAGDSADCRNFAYRYGGTTAQALRDIAAECPDESIEELYLHRAYHLELFASYKYILDLISYGRSDDRYHYCAYGMLIAMAELMVEQVWNQDQAARVAWLSRVYETANELTELRLGGFDSRANRLERQVWTKLLDDRG